MSGGGHSRIARATLAILGATTLAAGRLPAQASKDPQGATSPWKRTLDLAGSLFIGNRPQTVLTTRGRLSHADSTFELGGDVRFTYGEANEDGERVVGQRSWLGTVNLDVYPHARHSPFVLGTVETSLERRIDMRVSGGVGHKLTFVDTERAKANLSLALMGERSRLPGADGAVTVESLARFSTRVRASRRIGTRLALSMESFYRPEADRFSEYTFANTASLGYQVNSRLNLKLTYQDNYDSLARGRGARSNYDGQLVVGLSAEL